MRRALYLFKFEPVQLVFVWTQATNKEKLQLQALWHTIESVKKPAGWQGKIFVPTLEQEFDNLVARSNNSLGAD